MCPAGRTEIPERMVYKFDEIFKRTLFITQIYKIHPEEIYFILVLKSTDLENVFIVKITRKMSESR